jgi:hypothetical protein
MGHKAQLATLQQQLTRSQSDAHVRRVQELIENVKAILANIKQR